MSAAIRDELENILNYPISVSGLKRLCGSNHETIQGILRAQGVPLLSGHTAQKYALGHCLKALMAGKRKPEKTMEVDGEMLTLEEAKTRDLVAAAKAKEWKLAQDQGRYLPREDVEKDFDDLARVIVSWVDTLPAVVPPETKKEIKRELQRGILSLQGEIKE